MKRHIKAISRLLKAAAKEPTLFAHLVNNEDMRTSAAAYARDYVGRAASAGYPTDAPTNPLLKYFRNHSEGRGIWKWEHYFDIYHRHFNKFVGSHVKVLEIGIYSGGSLDMWRPYFGDQCHIYAVDIEEACK